jgi:hypothetical protein
MDVELGLSSLHGKFLGRSLEIGGEQVLSSYCLPLEQLKTNSLYRGLLEREKTDLLKEMMSLPGNAAVRRINELVKRARSVKVHAYIIHYLRKQMPYIGKSEKQRKLIDRLDREFAACARRYNLPLGDFPPVDQYRKMLSEVSLRCCCYASEFFLIKFLG